MTTCEQSMNDNTVEFLQIDAVTEDAKTPLLDMMLQYVSNANILDDTKNNSNSCESINSPQCLLEGINNALNHGPSPDVRIIGRPIFYNPSDKIGHFPVFVSNWPTNDHFKKYYSDLVIKGYNNILMTGGDSMMLRYSF